MSRTPLVAALLLALTIPPAAAIPSAAAADDVSEARAHFRGGVALYRAKRWREAIGEFEAAYRLKPHGAIHFNVAQCREKLQEWPGALRAYTDYLREVPDAKDRAAVRAAIGRLEARLATAGVQALLVYTDPPGAEVRIDDRPRGRSPFHLALPPGAYAVSVALEGYAPAAQEVELPARASRVVDLVLAPAQPAAPGSAARAPSPPGGAGATSPPAAPRPDLSARAPARSSPVLPPTPVRPPRPRVYTWVAAGTAVAAVAAGAWFGAAAQRQRDTLLDGQPHDDAASLARDARSKARTANVLYGVAGAAGAAGVTLFFVERKF